MSKYIITGDWHLRKDVPVCRTGMTEEEWEELQFNAVCVLLDSAEAFGASLLNTGDIFHKSQPYYGILNQLNYYLSNYSLKIMRKLAGNHDLPYHSWENVKNSAWEAVKCKALSADFTGAFHYGTEPVDPDSEIIITHQLVFPDEKSRPMDHIGKTAEELSQEFPKAKWIFTGDYHRRFHVETSNGCHVINPGCLTRQVADFDDYKPGYYLVNTEIGSVEWFEIGIDTEPLYTYHIEVAAERNERIESFIEVLKDGAGSGKDKRKMPTFTEVLERKIANKNISAKVRDIIADISAKLRGDK